MTKAERADPLMLTEYSDILTARQTAKILGIGHHQGYQMIDRLFGLKLSGSYKIAKLIEDFLDSTAAMDEPAICIANLPAAPAEEEPAELEKGS